MTPTCDLHDDFGDTLEIVPFGLRSYGGHAAFSGRVETVKCFEDNSVLKQLMEVDGKGRILVVDAAGSVRSAVMGDMIAAGLLKAGWAGIVIWGALRDVAELAQLDMGILALGHIPRPGKRRGDGQVGLDIRIGEARVKSGDFLVSDEDGTVIFPQGTPMPDWAE